MEKISIARRRWEKQKIPFSFSSDKKVYPSKINTSGLNTGLNSQIFPINNLFQAGEKQFIVEIVSGLENPVKMTVTIKQNSSNHQESKFFSVSEAAQIYKVSKNTIYRQLRQGTLKGLKIGRSWRIQINS